MCRTERETEYIFNFHDTKARSTLRANAPFASTESARSEMSNDVLQRLFAKQNQFPIREKSVHFAFASEHICRNVHRP